MKTTNHHSATDTAYYEPLIKASCRTMLQQASDFSIQKLSAISGIPAPLLPQIIRQVFGCNTQQLIYHERMKLALQLIQTHPHKMMAVALQLGYSSNCHFSKAFKRYYGLTPGQARLLIKSNKAFNRNVEWLSEREITRLRSEWGL